MTHNVHCKMDCRIICCILAVLAPTAAVPAVARSSAVLDAPAALKARLAADSHLLVKLLEDTRGGEAAAAAADRPERSAESPPAGGGEWTSSERQTAVFAAVAGGVVFVALVSVILIGVFGGKKKKDEQPKESLGKRANKYFRKCCFDFRGVAIY